MPPKSSYWNIQITSLILPFTKKIFLNTLPASCLHFQSKTLAVHIKPGPQDTPMHTPPTQILGCIRHLAFWCLLTPLCLTSLPKWHTFIFFQHTFKFFSSFSALSFLYVTMKWASHMVEFEIIINFIKYQIIWALASLLTSKFWEVFFVKYP